MSGEESGACDAGPVDVLGGKPKPKQCTEKVEAVRHSPWNRLAVACYGLAR